MTNLDALNKRVDRLLEDVDLSPLQGTSYDDMASMIFDGDVSHFSQEERHQIDQLITTISERVVYKYGGSIDFLMATTDEELETLHRYQQVLKALQCGDQDAASNYRKLLQHEETDANANKNTYL